MLKLARRVRGHFVTLIEIRVHLIRVKPGHIWRTKDSSVHWTKLKSWQAGLWPLGTFRRTKSEEKVTRPATCGLVSKVERIVATRGLEEYSPRQSFPKACTDGLMYWMMHRLQ